MKRSALAIALAAVFAAGPVLAAPTAAPAPTASSDAVAPGAWDLRPLYATPAAWDAERQAILAELPKLAALKGTLGTSAANLQAGLDAVSALRRRVARLGVYASLAADVNTQVGENQARNQRSDAVANQYGEAVSWVTPEVAAIGADKLHAWVAATPGLAKHRYMLETTLRLAAHTLAPGEEALLAAAADPLEQPADIYRLLTNADLPWPTITVRGKKVTVDQEQYVALRADPDPKVRDQVFQAFWPVYKAYERTIGAVYAAELHGTVFQAHARKYASSLAMAQAGDNIPEAVYTTLVKEANAGLPTLQRYFRLRSQLLGLKEARYSDIYVPLAKPSRTNYTVAEAEALTLEALKPMGETYEARLAAGFKGNWMDSNVQRGKKSGAYMNGAAFDVHPYLLLTFNGDYPSVSTLAHEWGHAMHTVYTDSVQPYETSDYSTFIAEIPSTANELLLADYMVAHAQSKAEKIFALSQELENLRGTFFRQAMFAEFELEAHQAAERGEPITGEMLSKMYLELLRRYHGDAVHIDDLYGIEWAYIPHFYTDFYVYQYATCVSAAAYFAEGIGQGDEALRARYFKMLESGASADPYELVKAAGVDLASPEPYRAVVRRMNRVMDELEALTTKK
ncbi:MAG: oligoendopeptidase F [Pelomonas sp.]|nr:oligoendopeptidase F [Roseateles sp.]